MIQSDDRSELNSPLTVGTKKEKETGNVGKERCQEKELE